MKFNILQQHECQCRSSNEKLPQCLAYQTTSPKDKVMSHKIRLTPWEAVGADIFTINNKHYLCIVDYHSEFPVVKQMAVFSADNIIKTCKVSL